MGGYMLDIEEYKKALIITAKDLLDNGTIQHAVDVNRHFTPEELALIADFFTAYFEDRGF